MPVTQDHLERAVQIARDYGATKVILFGSALDRPEQARDLDLAVAGVGGWDFYGLGAKIDRAVGLPVDLVDLDPPTESSLLVERWGRVLFEVGKE